MRLLARIGMACLFIIRMDALGMAQSSIITTFVGPQLPMNGTQAIAQALDGLASVIADDSGGFYVVSELHNKVYLVAADGRLLFVAGNGIRGYSGDGGPAASAQLAGPTGVAADRTGNLFIADSSNHCIRKVTPDGIISTVAGTGTWGRWGDGGPAISAQLNKPAGVALDAAGNLFIADSGNNCVRKVTRNGIIRTVAGMIDSSIGGFSGDGGPATSAQLEGPTGVVADAAGNLFIADCSNHRIRKVTPDGLISTLAGNGKSGYGGDGGPATSAQLYWPTVVALDTAGNAYIADKANNRIRKVTPDGMISTVAGNGNPGFGGDGGLATTAKLFWPVGVAIDTDGSLFIADQSNYRVRKVTPNGVIRTIAGNGTKGFSGDGGPATSALLNSPSGIALDIAGNLYIADTGNYRVRKVTPDHIVSTVAGNGNYGFSGDGGLAISAKLYGPSGVAVDPAGNLYIADSNLVRKVTPDGMISTVVGGGAQSPSDGVLATSVRLNRLGGITVDLAGNLFVADTGFHRVHRVTPGGIISTLAGTGTNGFSGDGGLATSAKLYNPSGIAMDPAGNLFIADYYNHRIRKVTPDGIITTIAGTGSPNYNGDGGRAVLANISYPKSVMVDTVGTLFIVEAYRIRTVTPSGIISTIAGNGINGFSGDGGPAISAQFGAVGVAVDSAGNLLIDDGYNSRIRKVTILNMSKTLMLTAGGNATSGTTGLNATPQDGYSTVSINSGAAPYGNAVFSFKQNGVTVTEAGVPASPPTAMARIFIDYRSSVAAIPARVSSGAIDINTGIAAVNSGSTYASVTYTLRNSAGSILSVGHGVVTPGAHFAKFIDQLKDIAPDFILPANFQTSTHFASLDISSTQPLSILALRMTINQRSEALFTTTPIADLSKPSVDSLLFFPQFADGGGYTTSIILLNVSNRIETGIIQILDDKGNPLIVNQSGGAIGSTFAYTIPIGGAFRFQTDGFPIAANVGWIQVIPDSGTPTPVGGGLFGFNPQDVLVTESGIPAVGSTTHARIYVDLSGGHNTGLAIANPAKTNASIAITAFQSDGVTRVGTSQGPFLLSANGHGAHFANELITGLPNEFIGVLDIVSSTPFAALTIRSLINERGDFLMATFPIANMILPAPSPIVFPHIADGGGYMTQFILISAGGASSATINYYDSDGLPLAVGK
jgi:sugar lactone lactonase YvrE